MLGSPPPESYRLLSVCVLICKRCLALAQWHLHKFTNGCLACTRPESNFNLIPKNIFIVLWKSFGYGREEFQILVDIFSLDNIKLQILHEFEFAVQRLDYQILSA